MVVQLVKHGISNSLNLRVPLSVGLFLVASFSSKLLAWLQKTTGKIMDGPITG